MVYLAFAEGFARLVGETASDCGPVLRWGTLQKASDSPLDGEPSLLGVIAGSPTRRSLPLPMPEASSTDLCPLLAPSAACRRLRRRRPWRSPGPSRRL